VEEEDADEQQVSEGEPCWAVTRRLQPRVPGASAPDLTSTCLTSAWHGSPGFTTLAWGRLQYLTTKSIWIDAKGLYFSCVPTAVY
jgi:hypothetical protein